jgi:hypothetical protein
MSGRGPDIAISEKPVALPKVMADRHYRKELNVKLKQNAAGEWFLILNDGSPLPATDAEVVMWLELQELKRGQSKNR